MDTHDHNIIEKDDLTGDKILSGHEYDNIKELDNRLPRWWVWLFVITIVYSVFYLVLFDVTGIAPHQQKEYENELLALGENPDKANQAVAIDTSALAPLTDAKSLEDGKTIWTKSCVVCHLAEGQGSIGPNLTDDYSIHGCSYKDIYKIIVVGAPDKGMISWKAQLTDSQIAQVASYILTLKGTNPPNPKASQGEKCN